MTAEATGPGPRARAYHEYLAAEGYRPQFDRDGDVEFKAEGFDLCCFANEADPHSLYLAAPNVWALEDAGERGQALEVAMHLQMLYKGLKVVVLSDSVWLSDQGFVEDETAFHGVLGRVIDLLPTGVRDFHRRMREETPPTEELLGEHGGVQA